LGDYTVSVEVLLDSAKFVAVAGHIANGGCVDKANPVYKGYYLVLATNGTWSLVQDMGLVVKSGTVASFNKNVWYTLRLHFSGSALNVYVDDNNVYTGVVESSHSTGWAGVASDWNFAQFDNFSLL